MNKKLPYLLNFWLIVAGSFFSFTTYAQKITGKVTDENGQGLPGVNIAEKGTTKGTTTQNDGTYTISVVSSKSKLVFTFVGYLNREVEVNNQSIINVSLQPDKTELSEVVVVGYGTQKKKDLTGAIASANLVAFKESPNVSILQSLKGALPGLTIGQTNQAGQEASINIRGTSTINGNTAPLIIVDGLIFNGRLSDINPSDVASVDVLKDPSSKAIYGSQAANGVVLVTTKTGKTGQKTAITYSANYAISSPTVKASLLRRDAFLQRVKDIEYLRSYTKESGYTIDNPTWNYGATDFGPPNLAGLNTSNDIDWFGSLTRNSLINNHSLSISGGSDKTNFFLSGGYTNEKGFLLNDDYKRYSVRLNMDTEVTKWLTVGANTAGTFTDFSGNSPNMNTLASTSPLISPTDANGNYVINPLGDFNTNPFLSSAVDNYEVQSRLVGNFYSIVKVPSIPGLSYRINFGNNLTYSKNYTGNQYGAGLTGEATKNDATQYEQTLDNILAYNKTMGKHNLSLTGVYGYNTVTFNNTSARGTGFTDLNLSYNALSTATNQFINSSAWSEELLYQVGSLTYNYGSKYLLKATVRRDGYSGFAANNKTGIFPSIGLGWVVSEESFFKVPAIDYLKIRGSYGENGNKVARYSSLARVVSTDASKYVFGDGGGTSVGRSVSTLANNDLRWERTRGINIGLDFAILKNKIDGNIEYFNSNTNDLLYAKVLPQTSGFASVFTNIGELNNTGFEFMLHGFIVKSKNVLWDMTVNFTQNQNRIVRLTGVDANGDGVEDDLIASNLFIGKPLGTIYNYQVDGLNGLNDTKITGYSAGSYKVVDQNTDGKITPEADRVFLGRAAFAYSFGVQNNVSYKNLTLRFFINSIQGGKDGYLSPNFPDGYNGTKGNASNSNQFDFYRIWSPVNPDAKYPNPWVGTPTPGARAYYQRNFVRLQDISLAYNFGKNVLNKIGASNLKLFVSGKNLYTLTNWDGWDPESEQGVQSLNAFPVMKSYSFGLELSF